MVVMLEILVMLGSHACVIVTGHAGGAMHRAGYHGPNCAAQRREPRREENDSQIDGEQSAHHRCQSTAIDSGRNACQETCHEENEKSKAELHDNVEEKGADRLTVLVEVSPR